jgi:parallel beta-helix repeat protein
METGSACDGPDVHPTASYYFNGTHISNPVIVSYEVLGWPHVISSYEDLAYTKFNGIDIGAPDYEAPQYYGFYARYDNINASNLDPDSNNFMEYYDPAGHYERANVAWLVVKGNGTDLTVPEIEFPPAMRSGIDYTINATIKNCGNKPAGSFNVSLLIDGEPNGTVSVPGLDGNNTITVSFFPVNLPYGCYEFKVVADCYNQVAESDENNNVTSRNRQVGYQIVVDGNDGFDDLLGEVANNTLPSNSVVKVGNTYYIQNMDIENCAGAGIRIENTNVPFVISSCTVHDSSGDGAIYLRNLVDGRINDSTIEDNTMKGIRLVNCSRVEIDNNLVQNNWKYGIDVYMEAMPTVDCEFINMTCNTLIGNEYGIELIGDNCIVRGNIIQNSDTYGIYMFGNDSEVYNNTIENSGNYGLKLDNAPVTPCFGNYLYWNDIIGNNDGGVQAYDNGTNTWNTPAQVYYPYKGSNTRYNYTGNYWDNHRNPSDPDGIMDGPYALAGGSSAQDSYPLSVEWRLCGDVDRDGYPKVGDIVSLRDRVYQGIALCNGWAGDVNCDDVPSVSDIVLLRDKVYQGTALNCCKDC